MHPLIQIGSIFIPTYYLLISLGSLAGVNWFLRRTPPDEEGTGINLALLSLICGFAGARLMHILFEAPHVYAEDPWLALKVWEGGFVFYGGLLAALFAAFLYCKHHILNTAVWLDRASLPVGLAYAIGRIGCFFNGCCYGKVCTLKWAARFPVHAAWGMAVLPRHPTQLYAAGLEAVNLLFLLVLERKNVFSPPRSAVLVLADSPRLRPADCGALAG